MRGIRRGAGCPVFLRAAAGSAPAAAAAAGPPVPVLRPAPPVCSHPAVRAAPFLRAAAGSARFLPLSHNSSFGTPASLLPPPSRTSESVTGIGKSRSVRSFPSTV